MSTSTVVTVHVEPDRDSWLTRKQALGITPVFLILTGIIVLAAFLNFYQLANIGDGNLYYTAAVKSMLQSWKNFFFVAAEPGGSVTVDKPPVGLWIETASAFIFGVNGFAVVLPNILAGLISIPVMYSLTRKYFGTGAGLVAALVVAITPVAVAAQRNNTIDSMLTLTLVLAAWAFLKAAETGKLRHLLLGALIVGIGFNIKMLQAFLPLPAFYAVYFLGAKMSWGRKVVHLTLATGLLVVISLAWAVVVDLTPADQRPYVGSSTDNTVMELIIGHNGLNRWFGGGGRNAGGTDDAQPLASQFSPANDGRPPAPPDQTGRAAPRSDNQSAPPNNQFAPDNAQLQPPNDGGAPGSNPGGSGEVGSPGILRFFTAPLSKEMSWLLPLAVLMLLLLLFRHKLTLPLQPAHQFLFVWGGWFVTCWIFFSFAAFFHAYYLVMFAPPLAALVGAGTAELWQLHQEHRMLAIGLLLGTAVLTLTYQWLNAGQFISNAWWLLPASLLLGLGAVLLWEWPQNRRLAKTAFVLVLAALLITPLAWSYLTSTDVDNVNLPGAYAGNDEQGRPGGSSQVNENLLAYLQANTQDTEYLMAVPGSMQGAAYVLATGRPVLYMGGFNGGDPVVDAQDIARMVADGDLRYVMINGTGGPNRNQANNGGQQDVSRWVQANCTAVTGFDLRGAAAPGPDGRGNQGNLYACSRG